MTTSQMQIKERFMEVEVGNSDDITVFLMDFRFFGPQMDKLYEWADEHGCKIEGSLMTFPDEESLIYFKLEWG